MAGRYTYRSGNWKTIPAFEESDLCVLSLPRMIDPSVGAAKPAKTCWKGENQYHIYL
jgi:hypothetical protein